MLELMKVARFLGDNFAEGITYLFELYFFLVLGALKKY